MQNLEEIRNLGIIAHIDAGKTTTSERMLYYSGLTHSIGSIDDGTTILDYLDEEKERGITIVSAAASIPWKEHLIHLIDTPGHIDFTAEVERSLRIIDGAIVIFSAVEGVESQSEKVWHQANKYNVPRIVFINKMDRMGASFSRVLREINETFQDCALPLQIPDGSEGSFHGIIDLIEMKYHRYKEEKSADALEEIIEIPENLREKAEDARESMIEKLANYSDTITSLYLEEKPITTEIIKKEITKQTIKKNLYPVFTGSAKNSIGIKAIMDAVIDYLPSPLETKPPNAKTIKNNASITIMPDETQPFIGVIFKVVASTTTTLYYLRTYSGIIKPNSIVYNPRTGEKLKIKRLLRLYAENIQSVEQAGPGDIIGIIGPRNIATGDTLCEPNKQVVFEEMIFPEPVISVAVEPKLSKDKDKMGKVLNLVCLEDPTLNLKKDRETGQHILSGMGELHLEITEHKIKNEFNLDLKIGKPRVALRETPITKITAKAQFHKLMGETELWAEVTIKITPYKDEEQHIIIKNHLKENGPVTKQFIKAATKALKDGLNTGGLLGYPLIYLKAELLELEANSNTTEEAVTAAVMTALNDALKKSDTKILEPIMELEINAPSNTVGEISNFLQSKNALIHAMRDEGMLKRINCIVSLSEMFGFSKALPKLSGGRATFTMIPKGYKEAVKNR
ncbi:MAG: elongation factor G [Verrucomicrobiota bacterium]|nr:elongation factor G [Verrucomicrobiota bacterium]